MVQERHDVDVDLETVDLTDQNVYRILQQGQTRGIFQFESGEAGFQFVERATWYAPWGIDWHVGVDGISLGLIAWIACFGAACDEDDDDEIEREILQDLGPLLEQPGNVPRALGFIVPLVRRVGRGRLAQDRRRQGTGELGVFAVQRDQVGHELAQAVFEGRIEIGEAREGGVFVGLDEHGGMILRRGDATEIRPLSQMLGEAP